MPAFDFPNPPTPDQEVTNDATGVTYRYDATTQSWVIVTTQAANNISTDVAQLKVDVGDLDKRVETLEESPADPQITYQIQTDKILRAGEPAIELVDSEGYFSNVKFEATGGIAVSSSASSIIIDGSGIDTGGGDVNLDNYYTKDEIDNQFTLRGVGYSYLMSSFSGTPTIRPGEIHTNSRIVGQVTFISMGPEDDNGKTRRDAVVGDTIEIYEASYGHYFRFEIISYGGDGVWGVTYVGEEEDRDHPLGVGYSYLVYLYPTHISSANYYDKAACDDRFMSKKPGETENVQRGFNFQADCEYTGSVQYSNNIANKRYVDEQVATRATVQYVNDEVDKMLTSFAAEAAEPDVHYGDYAPTGTRKDGDMWFDSMNLRLNIWSQGAWINPDRNDGKDLENRITALEARIAQLEGN